MNVCVCLSVLGTPGSAGGSSVTGRGRGQSLKSTKGQPTSSSPVSSTSQGGGRVGGANTSVGGHQDGQAKTKPAENVVCKIEAGSAGPSMDTPLSHFRYL